MQPLTEDDARAALGNATDLERRQLSVPTPFLLLEWDHTDFVAWRDPKIADRGYIVVELDGRPRGVIVRAAAARGRGHAGICNLCHALQPGEQVAMFSARRGGAAGERGDSIGTYVCADLTCHENVRLAGPLAPGEVRADVSTRIDGTRERMENFVRRVLEES